MEWAVLDAVRYEFEGVATRTLLTRFIAGFGAAQTPGVAQRALFGIGKITTL